MTTCRVYFYPSTAYTNWMHELAISEWYRSKSFPGEVILLDGISGTGKTMFMHIVDGIENVHPPRFNYQLEQLCIAISMNQISRSAGVELLQLLLDQNQYDASISRELNFRPNDLSSIVKSTKKLKYLKRLLAKDGPDAEKRLIFEGEKLFIIVHHLFDSSMPLDLLPAKKISRILCVRHPFYLFDHWVSCVGTTGSTARDFSVTVGGPPELPWYIDDRDDLFRGHSNEDKAAKTIWDLTSRQMKFIANQPNLLVIDFEKFVLEPKLYLLELESLIGSKIKRLDSLMRSENLPRKHINASNQKPIYRRYGSHLLTTDLEHRNDYLTLKSRIAKSTSKEHFKLIENAAELYESHFGSWF